jgi:phospholipase C
LGEGRAGEAPPNQTRTRTRARHQQLVQQSGYSSGSYTKYADPNEPGIAAIHRYLAALPYPSFNGGNCEPGADYLVNNYNAGLLSTFDPAPLGPQVFRIPSQPNPTIAEALSRKGNLKVVFRRT